MGGGDIGKLATIIRNHNLRHFLLTILIVLTIIDFGHSQNFKNLLTKNEHDQLIRDDSLFKNIVDENYEDGFTGLVLIRKKDKKLNSTMVGEWTRKNSKYGDDAIMTFDSAGKLLDYKEYNKDGCVTFDCSYNYKEINGKYYRIEDMTILDSSCNKSITGNRSWIIKEDDFGFYKATRKRKFGIWNYYDTKGSLIRTKDYGKIE